MDILHVKTDKNQPDFPPESLLKEKKEAECQDQWLLTQGQQGFYSSCTLVVISLDLSSTWRWPRIRRWHELQAEIIWTAPLLPARSNECRSVLPSTATIRPRRPMVGEVPNHASYVGRANQVLILQAFML